MKQKQWFQMLRIPLAAAAVLLLSVLVELFVFNRHALFQGSYQIKSEIGAGSAETRLNLGEERYIKTVRIEIPVKAAMSCRLILLDEEGNELSERTGSISPKLNAGVFHVSAQASQIVLVFSDMDGADTGAGGLSSDTGGTAQEADGVMTASNFMEWSPYRLLFLVSLFGIAAFLWMGRRFVAKKPESAFVVLALTAGIQLIVMTGTNQISYDEQTHVSKAWNLSFVGTVYDTEAVLELKTLTAPYFHNRWDRAYVEDYLQNIHNYDTAEVYRQTKMVYYDRRAYLPMAAGIAAGRMFGLPLAVTLMLGKLGNLLLYTAVCFFAIRKAKQAKGLVAVIALLPNSIFSASQFCYDACVNSFLLLAMVLIINELLDPCERVRPRSMAAILICLIVGSYAKPVYMLMGLMLLFFRKEKFPSVRAAWLFRGALTLLCLCMLYEVLGKSAVGGSAMETLASAGDTRTEGTNMLGQIRHIFSEPFSYACQLLGSMFGRIVDWFTGRDQFLMYAYLGTPGTLCTWLFFGITGFAALAGCPGETRRRLKTGYAALSAVMVFGMSAVVWTVLYLSFNAVGSPVIDGVQNRYFTPVLFPFFACFMNGRFSWKRSREAYYLIILGVAAGLLLYCSWRLGIVPYYL